jgi:hypothetical protein
MRQGGFSSPALLELVEKSSPFVTIAHAAQIVLERRLGFQFAERA